MIQVPYLDPDKLKEKFPEPNKSVLAKVADARQRAVQYQQKDKSMTFMLRFIAIVIVIGIGIEVSVAYLFNERLVAGNLREELSFLDQVTRLSAAFGMVAVLMGVVLALHTAFKKGVDMPYRVLAFLAALVIGAGAYYTAASVGYPVFGNLFAKLWGGAESAGSFQLDPTTGTAALPPDAPFWLRLVASSSLFIGIAFFVAILELVWLVIRDKRRDVRVFLARENLLVSQFDEAMTAKRNALAANNQMRVFLDQAYVQSLVLGKLNAGVQLYRSTLEKQRPTPTNLGKLSPTEFEQREANTARMDELLKSAEDLLSKTNLQDLVTKMLAPAPTPAINSAAVGNATVT